MWHFLLFCLKILELFGFVIFLIDKTVVSCWLVVSINVVVDNFYDLLDQYLAADFLIYIYKIEVHSSWEVFLLINHTRQMCQMSHFVNVLLTLICLFSNPIAESIPLVPIVFHSLWDLHWTSLISWIFSFSNSEANSMSVSLLLLLVLLFFPISLCLCFSEDVLTLIEPRPLLAGLLMSVLKLAPLRLLLVLSDFLE